LNWGRRGDRAVVREAATRLRSSADHQEFAQIWALSPFFSWLVDGQWRRMYISFMETHSDLTAPERLRVGFQLDRLWHHTMGTSMADTKEESLRLLADVLDKAGVPYALIGGLAVQVRTLEPRTTLDIDIAVGRYDEVPREALLHAGFDHTGRHAHSDNWSAPGTGPTATRTAVQFSAEDVGIADAISRASDVDLGGVRLRVASAADLIVLKLAAAAEPTRRPSKRQHDIADVIAIMEANPELQTPELLGRLRGIQQMLLDPIKRG
jgi:hypothetical protein